MGVINCEKEATRFGCTFQVKDDPTSCFIRITMFGPEEYRACFIGGKNINIEAAKESLLIKYLIKKEMGHLYGHEKKKTLKDQNFS